jgi:hypothetical protein
MTKPGEKDKVGVRFRPENINRARAAFLRTIADEGHASLSDFIEHAVMKETRRLERKYNDGEPWPPASAGAAPVGRPARRA